MVWVDNNIYDIYIHVNNIRNNLFVSFVALCPMSTVMVMAGCFS